MEEERGKERPVRSPETQIQCDWAQAVGKHREFLHGARPRLKLEVVPEIALGEEGRRAGELPVLRPKNGLVAAWASGDQDRITH